MGRGGVTPGGLQRWKCRTADRTYCYSTTSPTSETRKSNGDKVGDKKKVFKRSLVESKKVYIITAAQNATPVSPVFWDCLRQAAKHRNAELLVIPLRYKNPTSRWSASQANEEQWSEEVTKYLWNVRKVLNENLILLGNAKTEMAAGDPLDRYDSITGSSSCIIGHSKQALKCVAAPANKMAKIVTSTGVCTEKNYSDTKRGVLGDFHHTLGAVIVEVKGKQFHLRHVNFDSKTQSFTDLATRYYSDRVEKAPRALALIQGDTHVDYVDPDVDDATFGEDGIVELTRPEKIVWHDLFDGYSCNPHHVGNPFNAIGKLAAGKDIVLAEFDRACNWVYDRTPTDSTSYVVPSNHNDFARRWILNTDWRTIPANAEFYLSTALEMVRGTKYVEGYGVTYPSPLPLVFPKLVNMKNIRVLQGGEHLIVAGIDLTMHGDKGPNGSKGSAKSLRRIGVRSVIGHSHSPVIDEGCFQVGTSTKLNLEYTGGPSGWLNAHCLINADGKRQMIFIVDGQFHARY